MLAVFILEKHDISITDASGSALGKDQVLQLPASRESRKRQKDKKEHPQQIMYVYSLHRTPSYFWENYSKASMSQMAGSSMISVVRTLAVLTRKPWPGPTLGREEGILFISTLEE